jgi:uncharacterized membrane-anchored protein YhcB (DUF1043 family)
MSGEMLWFVGPVLAGVVLGYLAGRRTSPSRARLNEMQARAELLAKEREHARAELEARKEELARTRKELEDYRGRVVEHFSSSFTLLRALSLQYRADCQRLAEGAEGLFAEGALDPGGALRGEALAPPEAAGGPVPGAAPTRAAGESGDPPD